MFVREEDYIILYSKEGKIYTKIYFIVDSNSFIHWRYIIQKYTENGSFFYIFS